MSRKTKVGYLVNFKKAKSPSKKKLVGRYTILGAFTNKKTLRLLSLKVLQKTSQKTFGNTCLMVLLKIIKHLSTYLKKNCVKKNIFFYAIYSKRFKSFCGLASYLRMKPDVGVIEVGWIYICFHPSKYC